jgi:hypothetical protein
MTSQAFTPSPRASITEQQTSSSDQSAALVHFIEALDAEVPTRALARETDGNTALLDTINALVTVVRVIYP